MCLVRDLGTHGPQWNVFIKPFPPLKAQETAWKKRWKDCLSYRGWTTPRKWCLPEDAHIDAHMNAQTVATAGTGHAQVKAMASQDLRGGSGCELPSPKTKRMKPIFGPSKCCKAWRALEWLRILMFVWETREERRPSCHVGRAGLTDGRERCRKMATWFSGCRMPFSFFPSSFFFVDVQTRLQSGLFLHRTSSDIEIYAAGSVCRNMLDYCQDQWSEPLSHFQCSDILPLSTFSPSFLP